MTEGAGGGGNFGSKLCDLIYECPLIALKIKDWALKDLLSLGIDTIKLRVILPLKYNIIFNCN